MGKAERTRGFGLGGKEIRLWGKMKAESRYEQGACGRGRVVLSLGSLQFRGWGWAGAG